MSDGGYRLAELCVVIDGIKYTIWPCDADTATAERVLHSEPGLRNNRLILRFSMTLVVINARLANTQI
jgi:hypothetical protein